MACTASAASRLLSVVTCAFVTGAFGLAAAASRSLGAGPRAIWLLFLPVLISAAIGWTIRAQMLALPLYTGLLWLLATEARSPTRRVWLAFPLLVIWANVHGSVVLGALLVMLLGAYELIRSRGTTWLRSIALVVLAPLAILATPYGPVETVRYYHLLLVDPPFAGRVTEWSWPAPSWKLYIVGFYLLVAMTIPFVIRGRRQLTTFDLGVLVITFVGALTAVRGIPWFAFACMVFVPVAIGQRLESKTPGEPRRGLNLAIATGLTVALLAVAGSLFTHDDAWFEEYWPSEPVEAVRGELRAGDRVFAPDRFSDWMLYKIPELRGRVAYDVRFELYDREFYDRLQNYNFEDGASWKSFADGYRIVIVDETRSQSQTRGLPEGARRARDLRRRRDHGRRPRGHVALRAPDPPRRRSKRERNGRGRGDQHRSGLERRAVVDPVSTTTCSGMPMNQIGARRGCAIATATSKSAK